MYDGKSMGGPDTRAPGGGGMDYNGNPLGGGMGTQFNFNSSRQPQMGFGFNPNTDMPFTGQAPVGIQGNQPAPSTLPPGGVGSGNSMFGGSYQPTPEDASGAMQYPNPNIQKGFGMPPTGEYNNSFRTQLPQQAFVQPQPTNRFVPPNAPGVRMQPNRFDNTRNRLR
jgi:hypothetical protein